MVAVFCVTLLIPTQNVKAAGTVQSTLNIHALYLEAANGGVGEGDAVLLESNDHYLLMDTGMGNYPFADNESEKIQKDVSASIMAYLDSLGVDQGKPLDIYISHIHNDHFGGMFGIITSEKYNIGKIYVPAKTIANAEQDHNFVYRNVFTNDNGTYGDCFDDIEVVYLSPDSIDCGSEVVTNNFTFGNATVDIVGPVRLCTRSVMSGGDTDKIENNNSLCAVVTCGSSKYVSIGDALDFEENDLVAKYKNTTVLKADVFKENHHGYAKSGNFASNTEELIALIQPKYAFCQNYLAQGNVTVPRIIRRYGEAADIFAEGKALVYQLSTMSDGTTGTDKTFCQHPLSSKTVTTTSKDMEKHELSVYCPTCNETVTSDEGHLWNANGKCSLCGYQCSHTYVNDKGETKNNYSSVDQTCLNCRMPCKHTEWWSKTTSHPDNGQCKTCYILCDHPKWNASTGKCATCAHACDHPTTTKTTTKATKTADGKIVTKCKTCSFVKSTTTIYHPSKYTLSTSTYTYDGKAKGPGISIYDTKGNKLVKNTDYTVSSPSGRTNVGKYTYKVTLKGNYSGTASLTFTIKPKATSLSSLTPIKNGFKVVWKKQATQTTGYQVQVAANSGFTSDVHSYTYSKNSTTSASITKNLKAGKKYYVRVRTFKTVTINGKSEKIYSSWSSAKYGTTKK